MRYILSTSAIAATMILTAFGAVSQEYPDRPVTIIQPYTAGGTGDIIARMFANKMTEKLGVNFLVENIPGGGAIIGTTAAAQAAPDGYTLLLATPTHAINPSLRTDLPYDTLNDFTPVAALATTPYFLISSAELPARTVPELLSIARENPGYLNFASAGVGGATHLAGVLFGDLAGIDIHHIPFPGTSQAVLSTVAGDTHFMFIGLPATQQFIESEQLYALGAAGGSRSNFLPDLATIDEQGVNGFEASAWFTLLAPAGVPDAVVEFLAEAFNEIGSRPEMQEELANLGAEPMIMSRAEFSAFLADEIAKWQVVASDAGLSP